MSSNNTFNQQTTKRQERRIRWQHGLTEAQARAIAALYYGESV